MFYHALRIHLPDCGVVFDNKWQLRPSDEWHDSLLQNKNNGSNFFIWRCNTLHKFHTDFKKWWHTHHNRLLFHKIKF